MRDLQEQLLQDSGSCDDVYALIGSNPSFEGNKEGEGENVENACEDQ